MLKLRIGAALALDRLVDDEASQGLVEYALILALIALVSIVALQFLGTGVTKLLVTIASSVNNA